MNSIIEAAQAKRAAPAAAATPAAGPLTLHLMQPHDRTRWDAFVRTCPDATFFHLSGWQPVIEESFGIKTWFYYVQQDGQIQGVLPLAEIKSRLFGHSLGAMPFCVYGGPAVSSGTAAPPRARCWTRPRTNWRKSWAWATSNTAACSASTRTTRPGTPRNCTSPSARRSAATTRKT
jgi:hypothetical protein